MEKKEKVPIYKNFYLISFVVFVLWMLFFDNNSLTTNLYLQEKFVDISRQKQFYTDGLKKLEKKMDELEADPKFVERVAREKYLLKRPKEDVFILR
jgi:cell division protein FtsB